MKVIQDAYFDKLVTLGGSLLSIVLTKNELYVACADCTSPSLHVINTSSLNTVYSQSLSAETSPFGLTVASGDVLTKVFVSGTRHIDMLLIQEDLDNKLQYDYRENIYNRTSSNKISKAISVGADNSFLVFKNADASVLEVMTICPLSHTYDADLSSCKPCTPYNFKSLGIQADTCMDCLTLEQTHKDTSSTVDAAQVQFLCGTNKTKSYFLVIATPILFIVMSVFFFFVEKNCQGWCRLLTTPGKGVMLDQTDNERENKMDTEDERDLKSR